MKITIHIQNESHSDYDFADLLRSIGHAVRRTSVTLHGDIPSTTVVAVKSDLATIVLKKDQEEVGTITIDLEQS
jgi:hypothetical protein